ncbi:ubiquinone biosynthesis methyltransferase UbiE [Ruegeria sp. 2205SS24-7]|uniref:DUF6552 family protein n=1 Tax=Ruegeria discodermiae TaxID=3064389 RepID=UPI00274064F4|nr:DUF6552 family protein [Ruegeria sp. 2205SS24-7]MDP5217099.1 ubiquinone biosynthesis methyltransferase UbiE [Ruegeria sp. 2205SS24-7]
MKAEAMPFNPAQTMPPLERLAFILKWGASIIQIMGYTATALGWTPVNLYLFLVGVLGWFAVGVLWNDRAIMLIHIVALGAMLVGMSSS